MGELLGPFGTRGRDRSLRESSFARSVIAARQRFDIVGGEGLSADTHSPLPISSTKHQNAAGACSRPRSQPWRRCEAALFGVGSIDATRLGTAARPLLARLEPIGRFAIGARHRPPAVV